MKSLLLIPLCIVSLGSCRFLQNCAEADPEIVKVELELDQIQELRLASSIEVHLSQDEQQSIQFEGPANYLELLEENVDDGEWNVKFKRCLKNPEKIKLNISLSAIEALEIIGSGKILGTNQFTGDHLELEIAGSGDIDLDIDYKSINNEINGSGNLKLSGIVKSQDIEINGSGDVMAIDLNSDETEIEINGSGDVEVAAAYSLKVEVNGSGDVKYVGNPKELSSDINGSGKLQQVN